jgi:hypothetical protein
MRKRFEVQYQLGAKPIETIEIPLDSRDQLPPVLRALQYIYTTPELNAKVFQLLEHKINADLKPTGRPGMSLWEILVFGVVRLALDIDYDRLHHMANFDQLIRSLLGIHDFGIKLKQYPLQTLKDNVRLLDEETLNQINDWVVDAGHRLLQAHQLDVKVDSYVLETNVHFPTDLNLLWDACRKGIELVSQLCKAIQLTGWRKYKDWRNQLKSAYHRAAKRSQGNGKNTAAGLNAVLDYLSLAQQLSEKLNQSIEELYSFIDLVDFNINKFNELVYFKQQLDKHRELVRRRLILKQHIPHEEKIFSLFEPYTEWIKKGKTRVEAELGLRMAIASDQYGFILHHQVMQQQQDVDIAVPLIKALGAKRSLRSVSFDKGFWSPQNYKDLKALVAEVILPKKGKLNKTEYEREHTPRFKELRRKHAAVESAINCLEHHGLNRCPDKKIEGFKRYTALGVLAFNLHQLGNILLEQDRSQLSKNLVLAKAA